MYLTWELTDRKKINIKKGAMVVLLQTIINMSINIHFGIASLLGLLIMVIITGLIFNSVFKIKLYRIYLSLILGLSLIFFSEIIASSIILIFTDETPTVFFQDNIHRLLGAGLSKFIYIIITFYILKRIKKLYKNCINHFLDKRYLIFILFILNIVILFSAFIFYKYTNILNENEKIYIFALILGIIILTGVMSTIIWKIVDQVRKEIEWREKEEAYKKQIFYVKNMEEALQSIRAQRHDFKNHISCIYGLLLLEKNKEAFEYVKKFTDEVTEFDVILETDNSIISSLLNMKLIKTRSEKIEFQTNIYLPREIKLDTLDISIILGNLLDNAIEACSHAEDKFISIGIYEKENHLIIKVENSKSNKVKVDESRLKNNFTTKTKDIESHGYGLANVQKTVDKYKGLIKIEDNIDVFNVDISIPLID